MISKLRHGKRYVERCAYVIFKIRHHLRYSFSIYGLRDERHKIREIAHAIDKAKQIENFDPNRIAPRVRQLETLSNSVASLTRENAQFLSELGLRTREELCAKDYSIGLPSVRHYTNDPVGEELIDAAVRRAQRYPKSCSRESVSLIQFSDSRSEAAACFSGLTAFDLGAAEILAVVVDLRAYDQRAEFFAAHIDGSIFATGFCEALWRGGVGSCMLNWSSQSLGQERNLRRLAGLKYNEAIIMGVIVGFPKYIHFHAPRTETQEILRRL